MKLLLVLFLFVVTNIQVQATSIEWLLEEMPSGIGDDIVRIDGAYKVALNAGAPVSDVQINGITFIKAPGGTAGSVSSNGITVSYSAPGGYANDTGGDALPDPGRYEPQLEYIMKPMLSSGYEGDIILTVSGLSSGTSYNIRFFIDQSSAGNRGMQIIQGVNNSGDFSVGTSGHGETVLANFVADSNSIAFTIHPTGAGGRAVLNGISVFETNPADVFWTLQEMNTNESDVIIRNSGEYTIAANLGSSSDVSINNVLFKSADGITGSVASNNVIIYYDVAGGSVNATGGDDANRYVPQLKNIVQSLISTAYDSGQIDITVSGLRIGSYYRIQFLHDQSSAGGRNMKIMNKDNISNTFYVGTSGHGESVIAEFVATGSYMRFSILREGGGQRAVLNGVSVFRVHKGTVITIK